MNASTLGDVRQITECPLDVETPLDRIFRTTDYVYQPYVPNFEAEYIDTIIEKEDDAHPFWISAKITELQSLIIEHHTWDAIPATSTAVAEIVATERPIRVIQWIRNLLHDTRILSIITKYSSLLYIDNSATITFLSNPMTYAYSRHYI